MESMTSRERVVLSLKHEEPDIMPIDFGSTRSTGINAIVYNQLKSFLEINTGKTRVYDVKQLLAEPEKEILERFGGDVVQLHRLKPSIGLKIDRWKPWRLMDGSDCEVPEAFNPLIMEDGSEGILNPEGKVVASRPKDGLYFDEIYPPLESAESFEDIDNFDMPVIGEEELEYLEKRSQELFHNTDYAIQATAGISIFEKGLKDFGYENFLIKMHTERELVEYYLEKLTDAYLNLLDKYINAAGKYIQIIQLSDDLGMQNSTIIPPGLYRSLFKPYHKKICDFIKSKNKDLFIMIHSCGSIYDLIPDLIEAGIQIINPVQINAANMDPVTLKREFGKNLSFWGGGCSTQTTLSFGTVKDVVKETEEMIRIFAPGGGYVFNQVHNIQTGVSPEKIVALYDTALGLRKYPIQRGGQK